MSPKNTVICDRILKNQPKCHTWPIPFPKATALQPILPISMCYLIMVGKVCI